MNTIPPFLIRSIQWETNQNNGGSFLVEWAAAFDLPSNGKGTKNGAGILSRLRFF
jgi:hypothetical protein